jgi:dihydropteroate synthase
VIGRAPVSQFDQHADALLTAAVRAAIEHGRELTVQGADIIDVGGESTRPGAERVPVEEELGGCANCQTVWLA